MAIEIKVPVFPESVTDGTIVAWHKRPGEKVSRGEILVDIETDKVVFEAPATDSGVLSGISAKEGEIVTSGQIIGHIDPRGETTSEPGASSPQKGNHDQEIVVTPSAEKMINRHKLEASQIEGSGRGGRILKEDVLRYMADQKKTSKKMNTPEIFSEKSSVSEPNQIKTDRQPGEVKEEKAETALSGQFALSEDRPQRRVPMSRLRARIAERLLQAQQNAAILTTFNEVNMQPVIDIRERYGEEFEKKHQTRLGFMSFFVSAVVESLKKFPEINASIDGEDIVYHGFFDIGVAIGAPRGLVVPVLRDADTLSMAEIEFRIREYGEKAKQGSLTMEEITGGTFTITNGGVYGSLLSTPILNPPQSAILGMHKIEKRPVVVNDEIAVQPMMYVALSYDHRLVDGREAVQFLVNIKQILEDPARILLEL